MTAQQHNYTGQKGRKALTPQQRAAKSRSGASGAPMRAPCELPAPPRELTEFALAEWNRLGDWLLRTERVAAIDAQSLAQLVGSFDLYCKSMKGLLVDQEPIWDWVSGRPKASGLSDAALKTGKEVLALSRKFGLTARTRHLDYRLTGRPAFPEQIHRLKGTQPKRKPSSGHSTDPHFDAADMAPPDWFQQCSTVTSEWLRLADTLANLDLWTPLDLQPIVIATCSFSLASSCTALIDAEGMIITVDPEENLAVVTPCLAIRSRHFDLCQSVWQDYGMTPYDRFNFNRMDSTDSTDHPKLEIFPKDLHE